MVLFWRSLHRSAERLLAEKKQPLVQGPTVLLEREVITGADLKAIMDKS